MSLIDRIFGGGRRATSAPASTSYANSQLASVMSPGAGQPAAAQMATRRELLRVVLRDTLQRHGIPPHWITAETLLATSRTRETGVHWRLHIKHWDARLPAHCVALQQSLIKRILSFDPMASGWLTGISWQYALADETACPAMPHAGFWTAEPRVDAAPQLPAPGGAGDVIAGPVVIGQAMKAAQDGTATNAGARADLEALFAVRDADLKRHAETQSQPNFEKTQPMYAVTEPGKL